ncbi:MAG: glycosyl hydrolase [Thermoanaerobaculia bacterium]
MMPSVRRSVVSTFALLMLLALPALARPAKSAKDSAKAAVDPALFESLQWREIGPYRGGRADAVTGLPSQPNVYYFGSSGGGVWKTTDGGENWTNVSDGFFGGSIGAVAVADSDPNVVYAGTGEETVRGNVTAGSGVWKSVDAGKTWTHVGLDDSRHIGRIRIDPHDPDLVYVAAIGHLFGPNPMRGVYRSRDGGKNWQRVLYVGPDAGADDLILDPTNSRILYATTWRVRRTAYSFESGGEGSGLWKSTDGGDTWTDLTGHPGMPKGPIGKIGITVSPTNHDNLYAIVEAKEGGLFRSQDAGRSWKKVSDSHDLTQRAWYYSRVFADPKDEETVYAVNVRFLKSKDGGKTFSSIRTRHGDNHDLWIAPDDPLRMIEANDGGVNVTVDGGANWTTEDNQPTAQIYRVSTDTAFPYRLLGAQQDNSALRIRSRSTGPGIGEDDWEPTAGGESGYIVAKPDDPDVVYGGSYGGLLIRLNHRTGEVRDINPWPDNPMGWGDADLAHRFQWNFPILTSKHDPNVLYAASQVLLESRDAGASWTKISPDLTRNDTSKMGPTGGPITKDNTSVEYYGTIFAVAESPLDAKVLWAGSDDGMIHVTRDGGAHWADVTPKGMPQWIMINAIDASPWDAGSAYVAGTMYKSDDGQPYLYKTTDYGQSWSRIDGGIDRDQFTRVVRVDPKRKGLLYAGTEKGVWVSFDDGAKWQPLQLKLPITPVTDLLVHGNDLIAATEGRGFWILDDLGVLRQMNDGIAADSMHIFTPDPTIRLQAFGYRAPHNQGTNPPNGVVVHYWLDGVKKGTDVKLAFLDQDGKAIREFSGKAGEKAPKEVAVAMGNGTPSPAAAAAEKGEEAEAAVPGEKEGHVVTGEKEKDKLKDVVPGMNRFVWNLRYPDADEFKGMILWGGETQGPKIVPGTYTARLTVGDKTATAPFTVVADPRSSATQADLEAQFAFLMDVRNRLSTVNDTVKKIREVRAQLDELKTRLAGREDAKKLLDTAKDIDKKMTAVEEALYQTKNKAEEDPLNFPIKLNNKLAEVGSSAAVGDNAPTAQQIAVKKEIDQKIDAELAKIDAVWKTDLPAFNAMAAEAKIPALIVTEEKTSSK